jgi:hypothetical protein
MNPPVEPRVATADSMSPCTALNLCFTRAIWFGWMARTLEQLPLLERREHLRDYF